MYSDREGGRTKSTPDKTFQTKNPDKTPVKNLRELRQTPWKDICMYACTTKNRRCPRCV